ncbi:hypothetical protein ACQKF2_07460 [Pseudomonas hunanensis]|uniref:hypothetical protein n=1 Tax=Pseudomonas hunanensis TaxID=1247546 RepID=UPI003D078303
MKKGLGISVALVALAVAQCGHANEGETAADAAEIWRSGCEDFKSGMREGDFRKWLRLPDKDPRFTRFPRIPGIRLYMDGWDSARFSSGAIDCAELSELKGADFASSARQQG